MKKNNINLSNLSYLLNTENNDLKKNEDLKNKEIIISNLAKLNDLKDLKDNNIKKKKLKYIEYIQYQ